MNKSIGRRTEYDFSGHELIVQKSEHFESFRLKHPNYSQMESITFINTHGICVVTGDYGNYIFCRPFTPSEDGYVSDHYWLEKLRISSNQTGDEFNSEKTREVIEDKITELNEEQNPEENDEELEYLNELLDYVDCSEFEYRSFAYNNYPNFYDCEDVPLCKSIKPQLLVVFDAFEEICTRMKANKQ